MEIISVIFWIAIVLFIFVNNKNKNQTSQPAPTHKKTQDFIENTNFSIEELLQKSMDYSSEGRTKEFASKEPTAQQRKNQENTVVVYKSQETRAIEKKQKAGKEFTTSLPAIKATKPPKPEKPKKEVKDEEYKNAVKPPHPLKTFLENKENIQNAFVLSEILKQKF